MTWLVSERDDPYHPTFVTLFPQVYVAVEPESKKRLDILQSELKERLDEIRMLKFRVKWHNSGMNPEVPEHAQYVEDLCAQVNSLPHVFLV